MHVFQSERYFIESKIGAWTGEQVSKHSTSFALATFVIEEPSEESPSYFVKAVQPLCNYKQRNYLACYLKQSGSFKQLALYVVSQSAIASLNFPIVSISCSNSSSSSFSSSSASSSGTSASQHSHKASVHDYIHSSQSIRLVTVVSVSTHAVKQDYYLSIVTLVNEVAQSFSVNVSKASQSELLLSHFFYAICPFIH